VSRVPLLDLTRQTKALEPQLRRVVTRVLSKGHFILGPEVARFERGFARFCKRRFGIGVASGTDALELSLRAAGIGPGDEVITTAFSFFATAEAIVAVGARPIFADVELASYNLDPDDVERRISRRTKAILPVHLYGHPCAMDRLMAIAKVHQLKVIEDCAQAIGATFQGRRVGSFGDAGCLSFYPTKNLGGYGDGGMVVTQDRNVAAQVRLLRNHGSSVRYHHVQIGTNSRLDELQAAVLRVKLRHLETWTAERRRHAQTYAVLLRQAGLDRIGLPQELPGHRHVYHLYTIRTPHRARLMSSLARQGIATQIAYPVPIPAQPALKGRVRKAVGYPIAEELARRVLSLPIYPELTSQQIRRIVTQVARVIG